MLIALFPSGAGGISTIDENTKTTFTGLLKGNGETVEALTGTQDQIVGFDESGKPIAKEVSIPTGDYLEKGIDSTIGRDRTFAEWTYSGEVESIDHARLTIVKPDEYAETNTPYVSIGIDEGYREGSGQTGIVELGTNEGRNNSMELDPRFGISVENDSSQGLHIGLVPVKDYIEVYKGTKPYSGDDVRIKGVADPVDDNDAVNKKYVDEHSGFPASSENAKIEWTNEGLAITSTEADNKGGYWSPTGFRFENLDDDDNITINVDQVSAKISLYGNKGPITLTGLADPVGNGDAATKRYVDEHAAAAMAIQTLTLSQSSWQEKSQTVDCPGILEDETKQLVYISAKTTDLASYNNSGVSISAVSADQLTFTCDTEPEADLTVYVAIQAAKGATA